MCQSPSQRMMQRGRKHNNRQSSPTRRQSRQRVEQQPELSNSTELVLYNSPPPNNNNTPNNRRRARRVSNADDQIPSSRKQHTTSTALTSTPNIRQGSIRQPYKVLPVIIGKGSFGTVRSCIHRESRTKLAIKSIKITGSNNISGRNNPQLLKNEINLLQSIRHKNIIRVTDVIQDGEYIHIIMEQCKGGDLFDITVDKKLSERRVRKIVGSLLDAMVYLHDRDIVHRDLKAEHIMFSSNDINSTIKIIDFGVATIHRLNDPLMTAFAGSVRSVAPEVIKRKYGRECDLWSVGIITYFLLTQQMPFNGSSNDAVFQNICDGRFFYPQWTETGLSEASKDFIDSLLVVDRERLTAKQALGHAWIRGNYVRASSQSQSRALVPHIASRALVPSPRALVPHVSSRKSSRRRSRGY